MTPLVRAGLLVALAGCASGQGGPTGGTGGAGGAGGGDAGMTPKHIPCSPGMPCAPGATCANGVCASGCNTDMDCEAGQYCGLSNGQICLDDTLTACPATPCAPTQVCVDGLCATVPTGAPCGPGLFGGDGCPNDQICLKDVTLDGAMMANPQCYVLPPCSAAHPCSPAGGGALCNLGLIQGKATVCIPGACATDQDCPASWKCIQGGMMSGYGQCTDGASGQPCAQQADCKKGLQCFTPIADQLGTCKS